LFKIADRFKITVDEFLKGLKVEKFDSEEQKALARLNEVATGMGGDSINNFADMIEGVKQNMEIKLEIEKQRQILKNMFKASDDDENQQQNRTSE